ncbi:hypothetical protein ABVK25_007262 [Lepraria finkii]|uniref:Uncharacterized protein n=1 Tax=Lepraria finkii TaxID=1340010 RepID=A0ABR4B3R9_9LECA
MATSTVHAQAYSHEEYVKNQQGDVIRLYVGPKEKTLRGAQKPPRGHLRSAQRQRETIFLRRQSL